MDKKIWLQNEFAEKIQVTEQDLTEWEEAGLLTPVSHTDEGIKIFSGSQIRQGQHIRNLLDVGYSPADIKRIIRKVGFPDSDSPSGLRQKNPKHLTIGVLAEKVGVSTRTIKHWEDKGIIEPDMRSEGGFRLYSEIYSYLCKLIRDLQLFGYSLDQIKNVSDLFRTFLLIEKEPLRFSTDQTERYFENMKEEILQLSDVMRLLKDGIRRWEDLLGKKSREINTMLKKNRKRREK